MGQVSLITTIALLVIVASSLYAAGHRVQGVRRFQARIAQSAARLTDEWFFELRNSLATATQYPGLINLSEDVLNFHLDQVMTRNPAIFGMALVDARPDNYGQELVRLGSGVSFPQTQHSGQEWFETAVAQGNYASTVNHPETGLPIVILAEVVAEGNQVVGVIVAEAHLGWVDSLLRMLQAEDSGDYFYVIDDTGRPIIHQHRPFVFGSQARTDVQGVSAAIQGWAMPYVYDGLNQTGERVIGTYQPLQEIPWILIAEQPFLWVLRDLIPLAYAAIGTLILSLVATAFLGRNISRRVAQPIARLREGAQRIGRGGLDHRIVLRGQNELTDLATEFNLMAESLQISQDRLRNWSLELENQVTARTGELSQALEQLQQEARVRENLLRTIREMSSPVIPIMEGIIVMPLVGTLDSERAQRVMESLLKGIEQKRSQVVILDVTGLAVVDTAVANTLLQATRAAQLLGAQAILVGITPEVAATVVHLGIDISDLHTAATLREGLLLARKYVRRQDRPKQTPQGPN
jgi:anti-anti-sigma regulatory factor/HAMP domain-containing protein